MATNLEFILKLRDDFSKKMKGAVGGIDSLNSKLKTAVQPSNKLGSSINDLRKQLDKVQQVKAGTHLKNEFRIAHKEAERLEKQIHKLESGVTGKGLMSKIAISRKDFANSLPGADLLSNPLTLAGGAMAGMWGATQKALEAGKENTQLQVLSGSKEIGETMFNQLTKFATDTVFGTELYGMAADMMSYGIDKADVVPLMKQLGDISMGDANKLGGLSLAFSQVSSTGKLMAQDFNQMINAGFNPLQEISRTTGESMESLKDRMSKGKVTVDEVRNAFATATGLGGKFHRMLNQIAETPYGQLEGFRGQLEQMAVQIGTVFIPIFSKLMSGLSWIAEKLGPWLEPIAIVVGVLSVALLGLAAAQWAVNAAMWANPLVWLIALIIAIIAAIAYLVSKISGWGDMWGHIMNSMRLQGEVFLDSFKLGWNVMTLGIMGSINKIKIAWYKMKEALGLGDSATNKKMIASLEEDTKQRALKVFKNANDIKNKSKQAMVELGLAGKSLKWNDKSLADVKNDMTGSLGLGVPDPNATNKGGAIGSGLKKTNEAIATGGQRNTTVNITFENMIEQLQIHASTVKDGAKDMEQMVQDALLRVLAMATTTAE